MRDPVSSSGSPSRPCPLCGSDAIEVIARISARQIVESTPFYGDAHYRLLGVDPSDLYGISWCHRCAFGFSSHLPSDEFLSKLYGSEYPAEEGVAVFARPGRAAHGFHSLSLLLSALAAKVEVDSRGCLSRPLRILDVGCAYAVGSLGLVHRHYPYELTGVEWAESTRAYLRSEGANVYPSLESIPEGELFDAVILNDVLEHVPDPLAFLRQVRSCSQPNVVVWINVPDFSWRRMKGVVQDLKAGARVVPKDLNPWEHLSYFSPRSLHAAMASVGWRRLPQESVDYSFRCSSWGDLLKATPRFVRDAWRIKRGTYFASVRTSGLFALAP